MASIDKIKFPAIVFSKDGLRVLESGKFLSITQKSMVHRILGYKIVDCDGGLWEVSSISEVKRLDPLWLRFLRNGSAPVSLSLDLKYVQLQSSDDVVRGVLSSIKKHRWLAIYSSDLISEYGGNELDEIAKRIAVSKEVSKIISLLTLLQKKEVKELEKE